MNDLVQLKHFDNMVILRNCDVFSGLSPSQLQRLVFLVHEEKYGAGDVVLSVGMPVSSLYIVKEGECSIGTRVYKKGDSILESAVFVPNFQLGSSLIANERTLLLSIAQTEMYDVLLNNPQTAVRLLELFAHKIVDLESTKK